MRRIITETLGWILIVVGLAALVLPGPGLLALFAGIFLLAPNYAWAERRLEPLEKIALKTARDSVANWHRILFSLMLVAILILLGVVWIIHPASPSWWPIADRWWLVGGKGTGLSLIVSGLIALTSIVVSYHKFRRR